MDELDLEYEDLLTACIIELGGQLEEIMAERGLEISDLAKLAGLRVDTVHKVVRGIARDIPLSTLVKLALALECNLEIRFSET